MIRLDEITPDNYKECVALRVAENQKNFVSSNLESIAKAYIYRECVETFAIYNDDTMVGFLMLMLNEVNQNYFLWQFMIDEQYQGKGYGKQALNLVLEQLRRNKSCDSLTTTYKVGNSQSKHLYESIGFELLDVCEEFQEVNLIFKIA